MVKISQNNQYAGPHWGTLFITSVILASIYFLPGLHDFIHLVFGHTRIENANMHFTIHGDGGRFYAAALVNLSYHLHHGFFLQGIDWSTDGGGF